MYLVHIWMSDCIIPWQNGKTADTVFSQDGNISSQQLLVMELHGGGAKWIKSDHVKVIFSHES